MTANFARAVLYACRYKQPVSGSPARFHLHSTKFPTIIIGRSALPRRITLCNIEEQSNYTTYHSTFSPKILCICPSISFSFPSGEPSVTRFEFGRQFIRGTQLAILSSTIFNDKLYTYRINQMYVRKIIFAIEATDVCI